MESAHVASATFFFSPTKLSHITVVSIQKAMIKLWPVAVNNDQLTPKAVVNNDHDRNPFDCLPPPPSPSASSSGSSSPTSYHPLLGHSSQLGPSAKADVTSPLGTSSLATLPAAPATTLLSLHAPPFKMQPPPASGRPTSKTTTLKSSLHPPPSPRTPPLISSKGQIHVKLIQARSLNVLSPSARPYVVVQFEQNEFVSRDPTLESDKEVKGTATTLSRDGSSSALSALGAIGTKAAAVLDGIKRDRSSNSSPASSASSGKSVPNISTGLFGRLSAHNPVWKHEVSFDVTSDKSVITFNVYDRSVDDLGFLGTVQIKPVLVHELTVDQWYKLLPLENEAVSGEMRVQITFEQYKTKRALTPRDFEFLKLIGRGTFGRVFQVRKKDTKRIYAMKVLSKKEIVAKKEVAHTIGERKILQRSLESPFLVGLKFSFQTDTDLYLVTDFKSGGELFWHLQRETRFSEERARFYIAELVLALEHLHRFDIVYRDLKPENILLDANGHVALCDFGLSKADLRADQLTTTFCGTTEYLAPEILLSEQGYSKIVDFWSLGVLLFEMCCGWSPFYAEDTQQMYKNICFGKIRFPKGVIGDDGKQFVKGLLNRNPNHRLGAHRDASELKEHPFFKMIDWKALALKQVTPPFKPSVESDESTSNFDPEFTSADIREVAFAELAIDEEDPSEDWVAHSMNGAGPTHIPIGPLGSEKDSRHAIPPPPAPLPPSSPGPNGGLNGRPQGIQIKQKKKDKESVGSPLTNSVQANFRGFTYSGRESVVAPASHLAKLAREEDAVDEEFAEPTTEDEYDEIGKPVGRYANARRKGQLTGFEDDMT